MPVARYFLFVGGVLLALLLAVDALVPQQAVVPAAAPASPLADATAQARVRETYAQLVPAEAKKPESPVQRRRKIAKSRAAQPTQFAQRPQMQVAQQSHFGFFGGPSWNSTW